MAFFLYIDCKGLKGLFWPRKHSLISKRVFFYRYQPFLIVFLTIKSYFAINSHFLVQESPCWSLRGLFWSKKAFLGCFLNFEPIKLASKSEECTMFPHQKCTELMYGLFPMLFLWDLWIFQFFFLKDMFLRF
jgi:hypothetical protein